MTRDAGPGGGKYDAAATLALQMTGAEAVVLIVLNGVRGSAYEVQVLGVRPIPELAVQLTKQLRTIIDDLERVGLGP